MSKKLWEDISNNWSIWIWNIFNYSNQAGKDQQIQQKNSLMLVGMQTGAATVENSMEFPQKTKNGTACWPGNSTAEIIL